MQGPWGGYSPGRWWRHNERRPLGLSHLLLPAAAAAEVGRSCGWVGRAVPVAAAPAAVLGQSCALWALRVEVAEQVVPAHTSQWCALLPKMVLKEGENMK